MTNTFNFKRFVETLIISMQNVYILIVLKNSHQICKGHMPSQIKCEETCYSCVYCGENSNLLWVMAVRCLEEACRGVILENDWRVPERDLKSCDSAMGLGAAPTFSARIIMTSLVRNGKLVFVVWSCFKARLFVCPSSGA